MRIAVLFAATITAGMMAGLFYAYSISVMPALRDADAAVFVEVLQRINRAITNGWFFLCFAGTLVLAATATVLYALSGPGKVLVPTAIGLGLYAGQLALTAGLHIPLNNALDAAGTTDPAAARRAFEPRWVPWNHVRTLLCTGSFVSLCWALVQA
ncbi:anthrone oxygenase family protein [Paractinoplanes durhamensis]|uniref:Membrane protein n=1 Tax=Paractinoplanes durhamensis TaxID=113563 RepID=A0ABQ3ZA11_9ACTN|nr:anthrone oxygenase family protein [Actinoplanes durhamensis]GIE06667.1 membrane protein [Actinoplanes durhamensis]